MKPRSVQRKGDAGDTRSGVFRGMELGLFAVLTIGTSVAWPC